MSARFALIREIQGMSQTVSQQRAILTLIGRAEDGTLSAYLTARMALATTARARIERYPSGCSSAGWRNVVSLG